MSGHSKWENIKRKKGATDAARAKIFTKIGREIAVCVKEGGADPAGNARLRDLIQKAKSNNVPNDNIERCIKKAAGDGDKNNYEPMVYEGYGPSGVAVIVECLTDNKNRTAGDVRHFFDKFGGNLGTSGCVSFMFSKKGIVEFTDDYAYVQFNDHVHIYTGVTSVGKDESNVGFAYVDLRDGSIDYVRRAGAEEYSARSSAEGAVQQYHYTAIFPSMVNVKGIPTYFMGLVDGANLIKSYAFVSYENYQNVATGTSVEEAYRNYLKLYNEDGSISGKEQAEKSFVVAEVRSIVQNGNTIILLLSEDNTIYWYDMSDGDLTASFIAQGDTVKVMADEDGRIASFIR